MPRVRSEEQLQLALNAPPRPEWEDAGGDKARWRELQHDWVAAWRGRLLERPASEKAWSEWWKQSRKQHKALLLHNAASTKENAGAPPVRVAAVRIAGLECVTTRWLQQHAPQVRSLSASTGVNDFGDKCVTLKAQVAGEERKALVHYSSEDSANCIRKREETALLELASGPERTAAKRALQEEAAKLRRAQAPERARRKKLRLAEWRRRRQLGDPFIQVTLTLTLTNPHPHQP